MDKQLKLLIGILAFAALGQTPHPGILTSRGWPTSGLIAKYDFQKGASPATLYDRSLSGFNGTTHTSTSLWSSVGMSFGGHDYVTLPDMTALDGNPNFSAVFIVRPLVITGNNQNGEVWAIGSQNNNQAIGFSVPETGHFRLFQWGLADSDSAISFTVNTWYACVFTKSGTSGTLYVNGVSVVTKSFTSTNITFGSNVFGSLPIGGATGFGTLDIAAAGFYNRVLTAAEIVQVSSLTNQITQPPFPSWSTNTWTVNTSPIITSGGAPGGYDDTFAFSATLVYDGSNYHVYDSAWNGNAGVCGYASGAALTSLTKQAAALTKGTGSDFDSAYVSGPGIYFESGTYYMTYFGGQNTGLEAPPSDIGYATSSSLAGPWTKQGRIITHGTGSWNTSQLFRTFLLKNGSTYYMFVNGSDGTSERIGYYTASSIAGPWTDQGVLIGIQPGTGAAGDPDIIAVPGGWLMFYHNGSTNQTTFLARSNNLTDWNNFISNPIVLSSGQGSYFRLFTINVAGSWIGAVDDNGTHIYMVTANP